MKRTKNGLRRFPREFKLGAIERVQKGEPQASVARDLKIGAQLLARWRKQFRLGGEDALGEVGRPRKRRLGVGRGTTRVAELERLVGRQQEAIDFLEQALRQVEELGRRKKGNGATASSK